MSLALRRVKAYSQVAFVVLIVGATGLVLFQNRSNTVRFWFFGLTDEAKPVNVVWLLLWTASSTLLVARVFWFARGLWRNMRELRRLEQAAEAAEAQKQRAAEIERRERRLDEKLKAFGTQATNGGEEAFDEKPSRKENET